MFPHRQRLIDVTNYSFFGDIRNAIKIAFVSDLHEYKAEPVIEIIKQNSPEIILLGGDIVHNTQQYERGIELFTATAALCPTYCCLGNHEQVFKDDIIPLIAKTGVIPLDNAAAQYKDINIGGLSSPVRKTYLGDELQSKDDIVEKKPDIAWLYEYERLKGYKLLLCHQPEFYNKHIRETSVDLILSGHAHGGQWRFGNQGFFAPGQGFFPKYTAGIHENRLIISRGIGNSYIIPRINNNPEIIILTIFPKQKYGT